MIHPPRTRLADVARDELVWVRPQFLQRVHHLMAGEQVVATMRFRGYQSATATTAASSWSIERRGFFLLGADMRDLRSQGPVLSLHTGFRNRFIRLPDGRAFPWKPSGFLGLNVEILDPQGWALLSCKHEGPFSKRRGRLQIYGPAANHPLLDPFAMIAWYLVTRLRQRRAAAHGGA